MKDFFQMKEDEKPKCTRQCANNPDNPSQWTCWGCMSNIIFQNIVKQQESLPPEFKDIYFKNAWKLYSKELPAPPETEVKYE